MNEDALYIKYHVPLRQEVQHQLVGATVFSELDMENRLNQIQMVTDLQIVFQTHKVLHRIK